MTDDSTPTAKPSYADTVNSFTGHEEIAVRESFGMPFRDLQDISLAMAFRAGIFVLARRAGKKNKPAFDTAMDMTIEEVWDYFISGEDDADDPMPEEPNTDQGKDVSPSA